MMMEPPPPAALEMIEPELVLELLIVALDAPAQLGEPNEVGDRRRRRQRRQPILRGLRFASRPFDQQPLLRPGRRATARSGRAGRVAGLRWWSCGCRPARSARRRSSARGRAPRRPAAAGG